MILSDEETVADLKRRLTSQEPFSYVRFGDADLMFMEDPDGFVGNKRHIRNPKMGRELQEAFAIEHEDFLIGCINGNQVSRPKKNMKTHNARIESASSLYRSGPQTFHSAIGIMMAYIRRPEEFIDFCRAGFHGRSVLMIGGEAVCRNESVLKTFNISDTISLTDRNAYLALDDRMELIEDVVEGYDVTIVALGQAGRVLAKRLWNKGLRDVQLVDVGSVVDALANRPLRSWIRRYPHMREIYEKEFNG